eukprot:Skav214387  [mRNA]  locus=scaffold333:44925:45209:- [translate_table: standard]
MPAPSKPKTDKQVKLPQEEMDILEVSEFSPLRGTAQGDDTADLSPNHFARIEKLLTEMSGKIFSCTERILGHVLTHHAKASVECSMLDFSQYKL